MSGGSGSGSSNFMDDDRFDGLYMNVAQTTRGIEPLLDTVFSFLRRKTDFFAGPNASSSGSGGGGGDEEGSAKAIEKVNEVLQKHAKRYRQDIEKEQQKRKQKAPAAAVKKTPPPQQKQQQQPATASATAPVTTQKKGQEEDAKKQEDVIEMGNDGGFDLTASSSSSNENTAKAVPAAAATEASPTLSSSSSSSIAKDDDEDKQNDNAVDVEKEEDAAAEAATEEETKKPPPPLGNGGTVPGKYTWTQTLSEVTVTVPVPDNTRGRDVVVTIGKKHFQVGLKKNIDTAASGENGGYIINADLTKPVIVDDSFWTIEDGNRLVVNLQKINAMEWWESVCVGDPAIDIRAIQPENSSLADLDGDMRTTVEKMMYDQRQKALGLPTAEEEQKLNLLEKFKQQHPELDFSHAKIS